MAIKMSQIVDGSTIKNNSDWTTGVKDYITITGSGANRKLQFSLPVESEAQEPSSNSDVATKYYVDQAVAGLVNSAPATLDTIKELSDALGSDANFSTTMTNALSAKVAHT